MERGTKATELKNRYPGHVPILCVYEGNTYRILIKGDSCIGDFLGHIRKRILGHESSKEAYFILVGKGRDAIMPPMRETIFTMFAVHGIEGMLDITVRRESTFGDLKSFF
jgi:hypothetical protein